MQKMTHACRWTLSLYMYRIRNWFADVGRFYSCTFQATSLKHTFSGSCYLDSTWHCSMDTAEHRLAWLGAMTLDVYTRAQWLLIGRLSTCGCIHSWPMTLHTWAQGPLTGYSPHVTQPHQHWGLLRWTLNEHHRCCHCTPISPTHHAVMTVASAGEAAVQTHRSLAPWAGGPRRWRVWFWSRTAHTPSASTPSPSSARRAVTLLRGGAAAATVSVTKHGQK